jgi:hypothetical protein
MASCELNDRAANPYRVNDLPLLTSYSPLYVHIKYLCETASSSWQYFTTRQLIHSAKVAPASDVRDHHPTGFLASTICHDIHFLNWFRQTVPHTTATSQGYVILKEKLFWWVEEHQSALYPYVCIQFLQWKAEILIGIHNTYRWPTAHYVVDSVPDKTILTAGKRA